ncbi:MAG: lipopolysaccharide transport periplasmic protein LptA [Proteobacteria bacterium]|nr:lipopolysaccharide transport periplasmic protein LptA [Pseudomonadota bacterium]
MIRIFIFCVLGAVSQTTFSLSVDSDEPAQIYADDIEFDFKTGVRTYIGNVTVEQGTLLIFADKLVAYYDKDGNPTTANAWGNPARFKTQQDGKDTDTVGIGDEIIYNLVENTLTLLQGAELTQGFNTARGENIVYNMETDKLSIKGGQRGAQIATAGKDGTAPALTRSRPVFEEPVPEIMPESEPKSEVAAEATKSVEDDAKAAVDKVAAAVGAAVQRTNDGRSRIILMPQKKPAVVADEEGLLGKAEQALDEINDDSGVAVPATE